MWRWGWSVGVIVLVTLSLMPPALAGHSSSGGGHDLATNSLILHIVAAAVWAGGLFAVLAYALARGRWRMLAVRRFSRVAFWCVLVVGASGVTSAVTRVPIGDLLDTTYGQLMILWKVAAFADPRGARCLASARDDRRTRGQAPTTTRRAVVEVVVRPVRRGRTRGVRSHLRPGRRVVTNTAAGRHRLHQPGGTQDRLPDHRAAELCATHARLAFRPDLRHPRDHPGHGVPAEWCGCHRGDGNWPIGGPFAWVLGCVLLLLALVGAGPLLAGDVQHPHDLAHDDVDDGAGTLLVLGGPVTLALRALAPAGEDNPAGPREWILTGIHSPWGRIATHPAVAAVVFVGSFYVLYLGGLFETVIDYHAAHLLMNLHFLVSGYVFYWLAIALGPPAAGESGGRTGHRMGIAAVPRVLRGGADDDQFGDRRTVLPQPAAAVALRPLRRPARRCGIAWAADEIPLVVIMLALLVQWQRGDERAARYDRQADRDHDADLEDYNEMLKSLGGRRR